VLDTGDQASLIQAGAHRTAGAQGHRRRAVVVDAACGHVHGGALGQVVSAAYQQLDRIVVGGLEIELGQLAIEHKERCDVVGRADVVQIAARLGGRAFIVAGDQAQAQLPVILLEESRDVSAAVGLVAAGQAVGRAGAAVMRS